MALLNQTYNVSELPEQGSFEPLPAGWYSATIANAELKATKAGTGQYIAVRYDITGPTHEGRVVFGNLNISNPNPKAEAIGHKDFGSLMRAIGLSSVRDTDQLIGGMCQIKLSIKRSEEYGDGNEVKGWRAAGSSMPSSSSTPWAAKSAAPAAAQASSPPPAAAARGAAPPWVKKTDPPAAAQQAAPATEESLVSDSSFAGADDIPF